MEKLISWVEIPAIDFDRAVQFYSNVFGFNFQVIEVGKEKMACFPSGEGAISLAPGFKPSENGVLVSLNAGTQLDLIINKIKQEQGTITQPKTKIEAEGLGYFALFIDSEGNRMGLYGDA